MADVTRIVAIRHGETPWNAEQRLQGHRDIPLNALGHRQAAQLAAALRDEGIEQIISSDLQRAWDTALALAGPLGLDVQPEAGLRERCFGTLEGHTRSDIETHWPDIARRWMGRDLSYTPEGGESIPDFSARCVAAAERIARAHAGRSIAIVCHGGVLDCLYRAATRAPLDAPRTWQLGNCAINRLLHTADGFTLVGWNDTQHIDGLARDEL
ncbi:MAG: hypothetical protein RIQ53_2584 [Pseudomonadota bacterium]